MKDFVEKCYQPRAECHTNIVPCLKYESFPYRHGDKQLIAHVALVQGSVGGHGQAPSSEQGVEEGPQGL